MTDAMDEQDTSAPLRLPPSRMLSLVAMHADRLVSEGLAREGARKWHYAALMALHQAGSMSQAALSRLTGVYRSDLVSVINELAERGFVERAPDAADRRRNVVTITPRGREHLRRLYTLVTELQDEVFAPLTGQEREQLTGLLIRLMEHHSPHGPSWSSSRPPTS
ncbi:MarR family winged helix-turn-helix transcriptional regulator [Nonomuraea jiangxiensis]|uniref:DNA-binding transcriptional regulator, MarR family n=1 Tax=Nonomuraea jiangxiensis TaxID=633440 RepID=A0A1G8FSZ4_9ACTN|nr:MarR family transcriptional regulator [Nonomuraea jiangxiensis]SDH85263.1 DNA-binding transcriptional regulator, MarR family [Nonomuraea jiangxiensis]